MQDHAISVSSLVDEIKTLLEGQFRRVHVVGEISNWSISSSGHVYFTLSDANATLSAALFKGDALRNPLFRTLKDGDKILCSGEIGVYAKRGTFQIIVKRLLPAGKGDWQVAFEKLKQTLSAEGLFDVTRKRAIPAFPRRVAVITALGAAALRDFVTVYRRRCVNMNLLVVPSLVQGADAPKSLRKALRAVLERNDIDLIVFTRGGGSMEDLWCFNDEQLVRDVAESPIPVVSAIGHEVDTTLLDYVADLRAETPTAAAETITAPHMEYRSRLSRARLILSSQMSDLALRTAHRLSRLAIHRRLYELTRLHESAQRLDDVWMRLERAWRRPLEAVRSRLERTGGLLLALDPRLVLQRGYTIITDEEGRALATKGEFDRVSSGAVLSIHFSDGQGQVKVP